MVYVTVTVSVFNTLRTEAKSTTENNVPVVPPLVLLVVIKHPATLAVAIKLKTAGEAEFVTDCDVGATTTY